MSQTVANQTTAQKFIIKEEISSDARQRNVLLDLAMAPNWRKKASNALRRGYLPSEGLALVAKDEHGQLLGTVRLWDVLAGENGPKALMLGPLAVRPELKGAGIGSALMNAAIEKAAMLGHGAIVLMGDPDYYNRFGFTTDATFDLQMPGPFEKHRFLARELITGALKNTKGVLVANGRRKPVAKAKTRVA